MLSSKILKQRRLQPFGLLSLLLLLLLQSLPHQTLAQTESDAIMMNKYQFCSGLMVSHSHWNNYWEGTLKRNNENLGTVSTQAIQFMANYGISNKLNLMVGAPYIWTKASAGTLHGMKGLQDISVNVKWMPWTKTFGKNKASLFLVGGFSTPLQNYVADFLPLSIGLGSTNFTGRVMVDFVNNNRLFATASAAYVLRSKVTIDRDAYYDTETHLSNEIAMPEAANFLLRLGRRGKFLVAEVMVSNWTTLGGFDITRNNMPFPSNRMNSTGIGLGLKYTIPQFTNLSVLAGASQVIAGRNAGQATSFNGGVFYALYFKKKPVQNSKNH